MKSENASFPLGFEAILKGGDFRETLKSENASFPLGFETILKGVRNTKGIQREYAAREARRGKIWVLGGSFSVSRGHLID